MIRISGAVLLTCLVTVSVPLAAVEPMFPFVISYDAPDNATNVSSWLDRPAGLQGFVRVEDGHLATNDGPLRLWAANLCFEACFPDHDEAERLAARLARFGIGCIRFHHMDNRHIWGSSPNKTIIDPEQLDRLDYLIYQLKQHGIYSNINLHVSRSLGEAEGFADEAGRPNYDKGLDNFEPRMIQLQKKYARDLLTHVNPYTKTAYTREPAIAFVEINNENALFNSWNRGQLANLPEKYADLFRSQWNEWLTKKYEDTSSLRAAWSKGSMPLGKTLITNGDFQNTLEDGWHLELDDDESARHSIESGGPDGQRFLHLEVLARGDTPWRPQLINQGFAVKKGEPYTLTFKARGDTRRDVQINVMMAHEPWQRLGLSSQFQVERTWSEHRLAFIADRDDPLARITFSSLEEGSFDLADVRLRRGGISGLSEGESLSKRSVPVFQPGQMDRTRQARRDFIDFLWDTEDRYWSEMYSFLKDELQVESLVCGTQLSYSPIRIQAAMDFIDAHAYWQHPVFPGRPWDSNNWFIRNVALVNSPDGTLTSLAARRVVGKPYTVSEYNHPNPNQYAAEGFPMLSAFAAFQGWDALYAFAYAHNRDLEPRRVSSYFDIKADTCRLAHLPACVALFVRGDVATAKTQQVVGVSPVTERELLYESMNPWELNTEGFGLPGLHAMQHAIGIQLSDADIPHAGQAEQPEQGEYVSDTGQLKWNTSIPSAGYFLADTPRTKLFTGFVRGRSFKLSDMQLDIGPTQEDWATISLVCLDGQTFAEPGRILISATGVQHNQDAVLERMSDNRVTYGRRWGGEPVLCEGIPVKIRLPSPSGKVQLFPLDERGERMNAVSFTATPSGVSIELKPQFKTVWYELVIGDN
jgi:hypothetical protein